MSHQTEHQQRSALKWIVDEIEKHHMPYQIAGGLAAIAHGGSRPLNDIDLYMPFSDARWPNFLADLEPYIVWGPETVTEGSWSLTYLKLSYRGQKVEIGDSAGLRLWDLHSSVWIEQIIDYRPSVSRVVFGCTIDVMPLDQLVSYKTLLGRNVDQMDIRELRPTTPSMQEAGR